MESDSTQNANEVDIIALLRILWKWKYLVILMTLLATVYSIYYAISATNYYHAQTLVTPVAESEANSSSSLVSQFGGLASLAGVNVSGDSSITNRIAVLKSRSLAEAFIKKYDLIDEIGGGSESMTLWFAVKKFREQILTISEQEKEGTIGVNIMWESPEVAADWANAYVELANDLIRKEAISEAQSKIDYLTARIEKTSIAEIERVLYKLIENETKVLMLTNVRTEYAFSVVDTAVPPELRSRPRRKIIVISGVFAGAFLSIILVFIIHLFNRIREK